MAEASDRVGSEREARWIGERASGFAGSAWLAQLDAPASGREAAFFWSMVARRAEGEPLQYVLGRWAFRSLELLVDRRVLIPRPETESVVEAALAEAAQMAQPPAVAVDLGTGSGAIALSLAVELPGIEVWATERSSAALAVARANLAGLGSHVGGRVRLVEGSWYDALPPELAGRVALIVANPPYVADSEAESLAVEVRAWEPREALFSGPTGLEALEEVVAGAPRWLRRPGALVAEVAPHQAESARRLACAAGFDHGQVEVRPDLNGRPRTLLARLAPPGP
ncbi:MAG: peptide chain release factor N(5)-glutamine methyltransferase [Acidimicrobiales bacterium]